MKVKKTVSVLFLLFIGIFSTEAQLGFTDAKFSWHKGSILAHAESVEHISGNSWMVQGDLVKRTDGSKAWHKAYGFPKVGASFMLLDYGNSWLGRAGSLVAFMEPSIIKKGKIDLSYRIATGVAYTSNPFDSISNPNNVMHGSHINFTMQGMVNLGYQISPKVVLSTGVSLTHFSNGAFKKPNKGSNVPAWQLGLTYSFKNVELKKDVPDPEYDTKGVDWHVAFGYGATELNPEEGNPYSGKNNPVLIGHIYASKRLNYKSNLQLGINFLDNGGVKARMERDHTNGLHLEDREYRRIALILGHELTISSKVALLTQLGIYVYNPYPHVDKAVFQRYGLKYYFTDHVFGGFYLNTHFAKADIIEYSVGYKF